MYEVLYELDYQYCNHEINISEITLPISEQLPTFKKN